MRASGNLLLGAVMASLLAVGPASADEGRHKINGKGVGRITSQTATGGTTVSRIFDAGLLNGTTASQLVFTGFDPATGDVFYEGVLVLTTKHGTLTLAITDGVLAPSGEFSNDSTVTDGTGKFEEAIGGLFFHGFVAADGTFTDDVIRGVIRLDD